MKLSVKNKADEGKTSRSIDLSGLEHNKKFEESQKAAEEAKANEVETEVSEPAQEVATEEKAEPVVDTPEPTTPEVEEPQTPTPNNEPEEGSESSLKTEDNKKAVEPEPSKEPSEEQLLKALSEKLGKEINSFDDLSQSQKELDPDLKAMSEWKEKTGRPLEDFFKFQKDYSEVSDLDVAREYLQIEYPELNKEEIEMELESYTSLEDDLEGDSAKKALELKKYASKGRKVLEGMKAELSTPVENRISPEMKQKLEFAETIQSQIKKQQSDQKSYFEGITKTALSKDSVKLDLGDGVSLDFKVSEQDRKETPSFINEMPHWRNSDGSWNHDNVVTDALKIKNFDKMLKLAYEQGKNSGTEEVVKNSKNVTLGQVKEESQTETGSGKPKYENFDPSKAGKGLKIKSRS